MLAKRTRGLIWLSFVLITNVGLVVYLQSFRDAAERFMFGLPEAFVVLVAFVFTVTAANAVFGWYYLGKPDVSDFFSPNSKQNKGAAGVSETKQSEEA